MDCPDHREKMDYSNMQFEKGDWTPFAAYGLSKLCVIMFTRGLWHLNKTKKGEQGTTLITMDPGVVNTKLMKS